MTSSKLINLIPVSTNKWLTKLANEGKIKFPTIQMYLNSLRTFSMSFRSFSVSCCSREKWFSCNERTSGIKLNQSCKFTNTKAHESNAVIISPTYKVPKLLLSLLCKWSEANTSLTSYGNLPNNSVIWTRPNIISSRNTSIYTISKITLR